MALKTLERCGVKFLVDECLSPHYVAWLGIRGYPDAILPNNVGLLGSGDHLILARALREDRVILTANRADFRRLLAQETVHPGAIIIEGLEKAPAWKQILAALSFIEMQPVPADYMVNKIVEVYVRSGVNPYDWAGS